MCRRKISLIFVIMKHVFIQHSNITIISTFDTVKQALDKGEEVIIIMCRQIPYEYFLDKVKVYDFIEMFKEDREKAKGYDGFTIGKFLNYIWKYKRYLSHMKEVIDSIVGNEDFILYTANNHQPASGLFLDHKCCIGYYYTEDGTMNYTPMEVLQKETCGPREKKRKFLYSLFGVKSHFHLELTDKFLGTIGVCPESSGWKEWKDKRHIVTDLTSYKEAAKDKTAPYDIIIVTSMSGSDAQELEKGLEVVFKHISDNYPNKTVAVKMHPHDFSFDPDKVQKVYSYIEDNYIDYSAKGLGVGYSLEAAIFLYHPIIYSVYIPSSVSIYSIIFTGSTYLLNQEGENYTMTEYTSYQKMIADYYAKNL